MPGKRRPRPASAGGSIPAGRPSSRPALGHLWWNRIASWDIIRDFTVDFTIEVKKFDTQFDPGSTECVPK